MRIGFLFNHDQIHQVAHSLPIALALARADPSLDIVLATTHDAIEAEVERLVDLCAARGSVRLVRLGLKSWVSRGAAKALDAILPAAKLAIYRDNLDFFRSLDALVVAEKTSAILKTSYGLDTLKLIHTRHGAGDRAVGFDKASANFDLVLVSGPKIRDRLIAEAGLDKGRLAMIGYPKFDLPRRRELPLKLQGRSGPTILYNPHVSPHLSSWYKHGRAVLDFFVANPQYNLIFAPHVMLFARKLAISIDRKRLDRPGTLDPRYALAPNIHVDLGSVASTDMSYTEAADLYLGDVSSQIYEFLLRPRPCLFINSHRAPYRDNPDYAHWAAGPVIEDASSLGAALAAASDGNNDFQAVQQAMFEASIDLDAISSSDRAAGAILAFLGAAPASNAAAAAGRSARAA